MLPIGRPPCVLFDQRDRTRVEFAQYPPNIAAAYCPRKIGQARRFEGFSFLGDLGSTNSTRVGGQPLIENFLSAAMSFKSEKYKLVCSTELNDRSQEVQSTSENDFECFEIGRASCRERV